MRNRTFAAATLVALVFAACAFGPLAFITQLLIRVLHGSPSRRAPSCCVRRGVVRRLAAGRAVSPRASASGSRWPAGCCMCCRGLVAMRGVDPHGSWNP